MYEIKCETTDQMIDRLRLLPEITSNTVLHDGAEIVALGVQGVSFTYNALTIGKTYKALYGLEEGIFQSRPYVTVIDNTGKELCCHASRFRLPQVD